MSFWTRLCENAKTLNSGRISCSFEVVLGIHIASACNFEIEFRNIILVALRVLSFRTVFGPLGAIADVQTE
jgi:hypothetical protein